MSLLLLFALAVVEIFWRSFVAMKLWGWFVTPYFHLGVPQQSIMIGLMCVYGIFSARYIYCPKEKQAEAMAFSFIYPGMLLTIGWVAS